MNKILSFYISLMRKLRPRSFNRLPKVLAVGHVRFVCEIQIRLKQMPEFFLYTYFNNFAITQSKMSLEFLTKSISKQAITL